MLVLVLLLVVLVLVLVLVLALVLTGDVRRDASIEAEAPERGGHRRGGAVAGAG